MNHSFCDWGSACFFVCVLSLNDGCFCLIFMHFDCCGFVPPLHCAVFWCVDEVTYKCSASVCDRTCWTAHVSFMKVWILGRVYIYGCSCNTLKYVYISNKVGKYLCQNFTQSQIQRFVWTTVRALNDWKCRVNLFNMCTFVYASLTKASCRTRLHSPCRLESYNWGSEHSPAGNNGQVSCSTLLPPKSKTSNKMRGCVLGVGGGFTCASSLFVCMDVCFFSPHVYLYV